MITLILCLHHLDFFKDSQASWVFVVFFFRSDFSFFSSFPPTPTSLLQSRKILVKPLNSSFSACPILSINWGKKSAVVWKSPLKAITSTVSVLRPLCFHFKMSWPEPWRESCSLVSAWTDTLLCLASPATGLWKAYHSLFEVGIFEMWSLPKFNIQNKGRNLEGKRRRTSYYK